MKNIKIQTRILMLLAMLFLSVMLIAGCAGGEGTGEAGTMDMENGETDTDHDDMDTEHDEMDGDVVRIPNNGSVIRIVSPEDGATFAAGEDILVKVEIENFELNVDGSHWHVYVDGTSYGMVVGNTTQQVLRNLDLGEYMITAHLANGDHEELEDPGMIMITVTE